MSPTEQYATYAAKVDANDRRRFDAYLLTYLLHAADDVTRKDALEAAAADVNGARG